MLFLIESLNQFLDYLSDNTILILFSRDGNEFFVELRFKNAIINSYLLWFNTFICHKICLLSIEFISEN